MDWTLGTNSSGAASLPGKNRYLIAISFGFRSRIPPDSVFFSIKSGGRHSQGEKGIAVSFETPLQSSEFTRSSRTTIRARRNIDFLLFFCHRNFFSFWGLFVPFLPLLWNPPAPSINRRHFSLHLHYIETCNTVFAIRSWSLSLKLFPMKLYSEVQTQ